MATWMLANNIMAPSEESLIAVTDTAGVDLLRVVTFAAVVCTGGFAFARFSPRKKQNIANRPHIATR